MANYEVESANLAVNIAAAENITAQVSNALPLDVTIGKSAELNVGQATVYIESGKAEIKPLVNAAAESAASAAESADRAEAAVSGCATAEQGAKADSALQPGDDISKLVNDAEYITDSALSGYATESWVENQGYLTDGDIPTKTSDLENDSGFITGITSSDVTTALGYTPYSASNPNGFITSSALAPYVLSATLATVATTGAYSDLSGTPTIPAAQVNSDWNAVSGVAKILNKPTIPTVNNAEIKFTQGGMAKGTITLNQASNETIELDAGGTTYSAGSGIDITSGVISVDDSIVHIAGAETITGRKTFNDVQVLNGATLKCFNFARGTNPASSQYVNLYMTDSTATIGDNTALGLFRTRVEANGNVTTLMRAFKNNTAGTNNTADIQVIYPASGSPYTYTPTPTEDTNNSNQIDTVGARNTKLGNYVTLGTEQTITGNKNFTGDLVKKTTAQTKGTAPSAIKYNAILFKENGNKEMASVQQFYSTAKTNGMFLRAYKANASSDTDAVYFQMYYPTSTAPYATVSCIFRPSDDNTYNLGTAQGRWKQLFAGTTTISTSDERLKQQIDNVPDAVLDAWGEVGFYQYKFNDAVEEKGDNARYHTGMIAQRIKNAFENAGINPFSYGLLCYDEWEATEAEYDEDGNVVVPAQEAGNRYSLRYEECLCMEAAYQRRRADRMETRLAALEKAIFDSKPAAG